MKKKNSFTNNILKSKSPYGVLLYKYCFIIIIFNYG